MIKIAMITGYLGSGKTTLVNHILCNRRGIRAAVIVNDIGEVNIDADLIDKGGIVEGDELLPLTNGCICCTLKDDLADGMKKLASSGKYDYIIIEASGICEPLPIAYTLAEVCHDLTEEGIPIKIDNIIAVVDAARMRDEFKNGRSLEADDLEEDDLENLIIEQLEFCTTVILNKKDLVTREEMGELKAVVRALQKYADLYEATNCELPIEELINTDAFDLDKAMASASWVEALQGDPDHDDDDDEDEHEHHHHDHDDDDDHGHHHDHDDHGHHHHHHDHGPEVLEYGIDTFVYYRRRPFARKAFVELANDWFPEVIRCKGIHWYREDPTTCYVLSQAGTQITENESGRFIATASEAERKELFKLYPHVKEVWDEKYGDRMIKLVFIGQHMDKKAIEERLDKCLTDF